MENKDKTKPAGKKQEEDWLGGMQTYNVDWYKNSEQIFKIKQKLMYCHQVFSINDLYC